MVFSTPERDSHSTHSPAKGSATGWFGFGSVAALASLCVKKASRVTKKLRMKPTSPAPQQLQEQQPSPSTRSPMTRPNPKQVFRKIGNSASSLVNRKKNDRDGGASKEEEEEEWGDGGVWQREILMGDKCQPLDFSGVIYYDSCGKQMNEVPLRSPRASPLPGYLLRQTQTGN